MDIERPNEFVTISRIEHTTQTTTMVTVHCAGGCGCSAVVDKTGDWISKLVDTTKGSPHADGQWMVLIHGLHLHTIPFCSKWCIMDWAERQ